MRIRDWPEAERPREKLLYNGAAALSDAELLAIFLRTGNRDMGAVELAMHMLKRFSTLQQLVDADVAELSGIKGIGTAKFAQLKAAVELGRRYLENQLQRSEVLAGARQTRDYLLAKLQAYPNEVFACLFLDTRHRIIKYEELFSGTIDGAHIHPRELIRRVLSLNAAAIIFCHNHPSGVAEPSQADKSLTKRLTQALGLIDVRVLDHIIVGSGQTFSFAEHGLI